MTPHSTRFTGDAGVAARGLTRYRVHLPIYNGLISASIGAPVGVRALRYEVAEQFVLLDVRPVI